MLDGPSVQLCGALLFSLVFLFLWKQSRVAYFGYWSLAWAVESAAWLSTFLVERTHSERWMAVHALLEFAFALSLIAAARVGTLRQSGRTWRATMRVLLLFPLFLLVAELVGWDQHNFVGALRSLILSAIYFYSFRQLGYGAKKLFHFTLLLLSLFYLQDALALAYMAWHGAPLLVTYMNYAGYFDLALKTALAFSAMAMWIETQNNRMVEIGDELDLVRKEITHSGNLDYLTGLRNASSLQRRMDSEEVFNGVAVVCDLDDFKSINDKLGHIVGDEVLRNVGNLFRSSIRSEDCAYRWGGDEFAILLDEPAAGIATSRMREIETRLNDFRVRGHGNLRIQFSWGVAEGKGGRLRDVLEAADREMYAKKRERSDRARTLPTTH